VERTDDDLVLLWQQGNEYAFEKIYKRHATQLLAMAMRKTGDRTISEEFIQDVFLTLYNNKYRVSDVVSIEGYLCTILKNKILDHYRHSVVQKKYEEFVAQSYTELDFSTVKSLELKELQSHISEGIEKLPPKCKTVFKLSRHEYLSNKEIADRLQISENTVEQHMRRALRLLRTSLMSHENSFILLFMTALSYYERYH
jgi:RNA polymerase sigma-70 factor (ECF subfamily)